MSAKKEKNWTPFLNYLFMPPKSGLSKFKPTLPVLEALETQTRNKSSYPGKVVNDAKQQRQSREEMKIFCAEQANMQQKKEVKQAENIQNAVNVEDQMRKEDINHQSSNWQATGQAPFHPDTWDAEDKGLSDINLLVMRDTSGTLTFHALAGPEHQEIKARYLADDAELDISGSSGDEYAPPTNKNDASGDSGESEVDKSESDSEVNAEVEDEDEEKRTKKGKRPKPARADIITNRNVGSASLTSTACTEARCKANYEYDSSFTTLYDFVFFLIKT